jgi:hypothetical protein
MFEMSARLAYSNPANQLEWGDKLGDYDSLQFSSRFASADTICSFLLSCMGTTFRMTA